MKVIQVTTSSKGGAGIAALRLHKALHGAGVQSAYISLDYTLSFNDLEIKDPFFTYKKPSVLKRLLQKFKKKTPTQAYKNKWAQWEENLDYEIISFPFSQYRLQDHPLIQQADIINLHWVGDLLDFESFFSVNKKPIAWTFHDMNPFKGIFHYQGDQDNNLVVKEIDEEIRIRKREATKKIPTGAVISPSQWLIEAAAKSGHFEHFKEKVCIPNGIDLEVFKEATGVNLRRDLGIMAEAKVLLYASGTLDNARKGIDLMLEALEALTISVTVLTLGKGRVETSNKAVKIIPLGFLSDASKIAACYAAADAFVLPSREDNLPNTMLESFATGTPVISFATGGMKEHIINEFNGVLAEEISAVSLAKAMERLFANMQIFDPDAIRTYAKKHFSLAKQAEGYIKVYNNLLNQ